MLSLKFLGALRDVGLLIMRIGLGLSMMIHGSTKVFGGVETWTKIGSAIQYMGIHSGFAYWGFICAIVEFAGGILFILGFLFRPAAILLFLNMVVATLMMIKTGNHFVMYSHPLELGVVFFGLIFVGAGNLSIDGG